MKKRNGHSWGCLIVGESVYQRVIHGRFTRSLTVRRFIPPDWDYVRVTLVDRYTDSVLVRLELVR